MQRVTAIIKPFKLDDAARSVVEYRYRRRAWSVRLRNIPASDSEIRENRTARG